MRHVSHVKLCGWLAVLFERWEYLEEWPLLLRQADFADECGEARVGAQGVE